MIAKNKNTVQSGIYNLHTEYIQNTAKNDYQKEPISSDKNGFSLGINTKSSSTPENTDFEPVFPIILERYFLLAQAREILYSEGRKIDPKKPFDFHRCAKCMYIEFADQISLFQSKEHKRCFLAGLVTCGSVWGCPVCCPKIQERRRLEVAWAMDWHYGDRNPSKLEPELRAKLDAFNAKNGKKNSSPGKCIMPTLTFPHTQFDNLEDLILKQRKALKLFRGGRAFQKFYKEIGFVGLIRSLEIIYGQNGYHPHTHELWLVGLFVDAEKFKNQILIFWRDACIKAGLLEPLDFSNRKSLERHYHFSQHAVDVKDWCSNSDYLNKMDDSKHWGVDRELAKASSKDGRQKGIHPFGFLKLYADGAENYKNLYLDFITTVTKLRCRQLYFSPGLKKMIGVKDMTDEEIAAKQDDEAKFLLHISIDDWKVIRKFDPQGNIIILGQTGGIEAVNDYIESLKRIAKPLESNIL